MTYATNDTNGVRSIVDELNARVLADQAAIAQRYRLLLERVSAGEIDPNRLRAEYQALVQEHSAQLLNDLTTLGAEYYRSILDLNRRYVEQMLEQLGGVSPTEPTSPAFGESEKPRPAVRGDLRMGGRLGESAIATFVVENPDEEPALVRFFVSDIAAPDGHSCGTIQVEPHELWLVGFGEAEIRASVPLDPVRFEAGTQYRGQILTQGVRDFVVDVTLVVDEPAETPASS